MLIAFIIVGVLMYMTVLSLGELAIMYPINGAFYEYSVRFIDPSWCVFLIITSRTRGMKWRILNGCFPGALQWAGSMHLAGWLHCKIA